MVLVARAPMQTNTLWALLIGTIMFVSCFVAFNSLIPGETKISFKNYEKTYIPPRPGEDIKASDFNLYSMTTNVTLTNMGSGSIPVTGLDITWRWMYVPALGVNYFIFNHVEWRLPILNIEVIMHGILTEETNEPLTASYLLGAYENTTMASRVVLKCSHITLNLKFRANDTSIGLPQALSEGLPILMDVNYEIDFSAMGANVWSVMASVLLFQTIKTGSWLMDLLLNSLVSLPVWSSMAYILYRIIAGLIPTASGGGGQ